LISIAFDWKSRLPFARRIGIAYLAFAAITYLLPGYLGFKQYARWLENDIWSRLISPYPNDGGFQDTECCALVEGAEYHVGTHRMVPESPHDEASTLIIAVSLVAIAGAFLMARSKPLGYYIWVCIIACSIVRFSYYLFMGIKFWGLSSIHYQIVWDISYVTAFLLSLPGWRNPTAGEGSVPSVSTSDPS